MIWKMVVGVNMGYVLLMNGFLSFLDCSLCVKVCDKIETKLLKINIKNNLNMKLRNYHSTFMSTAQLENPQFYNLDFVINLPSTSHHRKTHIVEQIHKFTPFPYFRKENI